MKRFALAVLILVASLHAPLYADDTQSKSSIPASAKAAEQAREHTNGEEEHGEAHESKKYFGIPDWILETLNLLLFVGVLGYFLKGPIGTAFRERRTKIAAELAEAKARREKADRLAEDIQSRLSQIEQEVGSIMKRAEEDGERQRRELIAGAEAEAEKIVANARNEVDARLKSAKQELTAYAGELATRRAHQILRESMTDQDRKKLFEESLDQIGEKRS